MAKFPFIFGILKFGTRRLCFSSIHIWNLTRNIRLGSGGAALQIFHLTYGSSNHFKKSGTDRIGLFINIEDS